MRDRRTTRPPSAAWWHSSAVEWEDDMRSKVAINRYAARHPRREGVPLHLNTEEKTRVGVGGPMPGYPHEAGNVP